MLGLLVCVAIVVWMWSEPASVSVKSYKTGTETLEKALELGEQRSEEAFQGNRDPSLKKALELGKNAANQANQRNRDSSQNTPAANGGASNQLQMPDHGVGKIIEEME